MMPLACFVDDKGTLFVADAGRLQVVVFSSNGNYSRVIGLPDNFKPTDVFVFDDKVWIANNSGNKIHIFSNIPPFDQIGEISGGEKEEEGHLYQPVSVAVSETGVYVCDAMGFDVKVFDHEGNYKHTIGSHGRNSGQFARPKGLAVDKNENVFVVDAAFQNVQMFRSDGQLLMFFGQAYQGPGDMYMPVRILIDYDYTEDYEKYLLPEFELDYLIFISNQFGPDKINVYGFLKQGK